MKELEEKIKELQERLVYLETVEAERVRQMRLASDMGDDYRENEAAKQAMLEHNILHDRIFSLKKEIWELKKKMTARRK